MRGTLLSVVAFCLCLQNGLMQSEVGDSCSHNGDSGKCSNIRDCTSAQKRPRDNKICGFAEDGYPIVCCLENNFNRFQATPATVQSTTRYVPETVEYQDVSQNAGGCAPLTSSQTAEKTGRKAWDKCIEYQEQLVYPCKKGVDYLGRLARQNNCNHKADELIVGGVDAKRNEFPHMALLGFGEDAATAEYQCGGAVISERYILTAAHCTSTKLQQKVSYAKVGLLKRSDPVPDSRVHRISKIIKHPEYKPPSKYNDIALLLTETPMILDEGTVPACLDVGAGVDAARGAVTGWGDTETLGKSTDVLQKVTLAKFTSAECARKYQKGRLLMKGFDEATQVCYGDHTEKKDTCQGDSGGPLQVNNNRIHCMYTIVGVTSYGKNCGEIGQPGMYTRVSAYTSWIESVVWP